MKPTRLPSVVDNLTARLETSIITGELAAGKRLTEHWLADRFGVSRGPLREALRRLEGRRLIVRTHNVGAKVASFDAGQLREMLVVREALEGMAARLAATLMTTDEVEELKRLADKQEYLERQDQYSPEYQGPNLDFHARIARGARNTKLYEMIYGDPFYMLRLFRYRGSALAGRAAMAITEHQLIAAAFAARDPDAAESAMRTHVSRSHANILEHIDTMGVSTPESQPAARRD